MNEEQLLEVLEAFKNDILKQVDIKNGGTAASLTKEFTKKLEALQTAPAQEPEFTPAPEPTSEGQLSLKALQAQVEQLQAEKQQQERELALKNRDSAISSAFSNRKVQFGDKATRAFLLENSDKIKQEGSNYFIEDGDNVVPLDKAVDGFLSTDFGQMFQPASKGRGMNMRAPKGEQSAGRRQTKSLNEMLVTPDND